MERDFEKEQQYLKVVKRVKAIKYFYVHLALFLIFNGALIVWAILNADRYNERLLVWGVSSIVISWVIGIIIHALAAFGNRILFSKKWEDRKMDEFLDEDEKLWE